MPCGRRPGSVADHAVLRQITVDVGDEEREPPDMTRVLVAYASKRGSTGEIADAIVDVLRDSGLDADAKPVEDVESIASYDAVVLGSAVYMKRWRGDAKHFLRKHGEELSQLPFWVFSSGPVGDPTKAPDPSLARAAADNRPGGAARRPRSHRVRRPRASAAARSARALDGQEHPRAVPRPARLGRDPRLGEADRVRAAHARTGGLKAARA